MLSTEQACGLRVKTNLLHACNANAQTYTIDAGRTVRRESARFDAPSNSLHFRLMSEKYTRTLQNTHMHTSLKTHCQT